MFLKKRAFLEVRMVAQSLGLVPAIVSNIKQKRETAAVTKKIAKDYFVQKGDSLYSIAKKYPGITISDIKKWNGIRDEKITPGMKLKISG